MATATRKNLRGKKPRGAQPVRTYAPEPEAPLPSPYLAERLRPEELEGYSVGDTVRVDGESGATFRVVGFVVPVSSADPAMSRGPWADLIGGSKNATHCFRSVLVGRLRSTTRVAARSVGEVNATVNKRTKTAPAGSPELAAALRSYRAEKGWSRRELAEACGLHGGLLDRLEGGTRGLGADERAALQAVDGMPVLP